MLAIRAAHLFDGERFWPGPATVVTNGPTVLGIEQGHPDLPDGTDVLDLGEVTMPGDEAESGRGLALALASLDHLTHERVDGRNRWTMVCERADS